jgi:peptide chain release factor
MGKEEELQARMEKLGIKESDLIEKFILGSGSGGQKINKTSSCVYLKHIPTGIEIKCQRDRSRELNRYYARRELCERIERDILKLKTEKDHEISKIRRQKKRRTRRVQQKVLEEKRARSSTKSLRQSPSAKED